MKPPHVEYRCPASVEEAIELIVEHAGEARPLAGGQSFVPLLNLRLARPEMLVDLNRIPILAEAAVEARRLSFGAMTRTARLEARDVATACPILAAAAQFVGHPQIRARGTIGGSIAHADPAAELPAVALLLDATVHLRGPRGVRAVPAAGFFLGIFSTACEWDEVVIGVEFEPPGAEFGWGFREFARRPGDYALAGVATLLRMSGDVISSIKLVAFGVGGKPVRAHAAERALLERNPDAGALADARDALAGEISPTDSIHGSADYRRHLAGVLLQRAVRDALDRLRAPHDRAA